MTKSVKLLKSKNTGQIIEQTLNTKKTIFNRFNEDDFIQIGRLLWYNYDVQNNVGAMDINVNGHNALEIFTKKAQDHITRNGGNIRLNNFNGTVPDISKSDFTILINQWNNANFNQLSNFRRSVGFLTNNLLYLNKIKESVIDLENVFKELSEEFELSTENIEDKNLQKFQYWRNRIILDTVNNFHYSKINRNFLAFIILHMFILCNDEFIIEDYENVFDGGKTTILLKNMLNLKIKKIKNELKKKKSRSKKSKRKSRSKSRRN
jgi:hypothetical protein